MHFIWFGRSATLVDIFRNQTCCVCSSLLCWIFRYFDWNLNLTALYNSEFKFFHIIKIFVVVKQFFCFVINQSHVNCRTKSRLIWTNRNSIILTLINCDSKFWRLSFTHCCTSRIIRHVVSSRVRCWTFGLMKIQTIVLCRNADSHQTCYCQC